MRISFHQLTKVECAISIKNRGQFDHLAMAKPMTSPCYQAAARNVENDPIQ
jgi:hypothetical protein